MRLVIDMQGAQSTGSRNRGIGRYTTALVKAMLQLKQEHDVHLLLNGAFADTIDLIRREYLGMLPDQNFHIWHPVTPVFSLDQKNKFRRQVSERVRESIIDQLEPDAVLITSLFEGFDSDAVVSIGEHSLRIPSVVVLYDLIPLIHSKIYLENPLVERWYLQKIAQIRRATHLLSISASSGNEAVRYLGFPNDAVTNISTACDAHFIRKLQDNNRLAEIQAKYGLNKPFVMYTGGIDHRKNIEGLIRAYSNLPTDVRSQHQLAVVCSVQPPERQRLEVLASGLGLGSADFVMTGFVPEADLVDIYNSCKVFIFPSWHEGFGLPALEAMACGRAVIGSNTSSVPEVIGRDDALFNPYSDADISAALLRVLTDDAYRAELEAHGLLQANKFSWRESALRAWVAIEELLSHPKKSSHTAMVVRRPRLAYVSPVPLARSGIADYSAELLPELSRHYQIDVIVSQDELVSESWIQANHNVHDVAWFRAHVDEYDRVLYHVGNSHFHVHMFQLMDEVPGTVVLHDFFLSGIASHLEMSGQMPGFWVNALHYSHGWPAVIFRYSVTDTADAVWRFPCNLHVLQAAQGIIVHSPNSKRLAEQWYGQGVADDWAHIPHMRVPVVKPDRASARNELGLPDNVFVVCSFGLLGRTKLNHRLLSAWRQSSLGSDSRCRLVFVGQNEGGAYGAEMARLVRGAGGSVEITGWADADVYKRWLSAADVAVQLRTLSRGETSGTVLDCMNYSLATILNAHGSLSDMPEDVVLKLPDEFTDEELAQALNLLWGDTAGRIRLGCLARNRIEHEHQPRVCAEQYFTAIEGFYQQAQRGSRGIIKEVKPESPGDLEDLASALAVNFPHEPQLPTLLLDISELVRSDSDAKSNIHKIASLLLLELLRAPPMGWRVEAIYMSVESRKYCYARKYSCHILSLPSDWATDSPVEVFKGDRLLILNSSPNILLGQLNTIQRWRSIGVGAFAVLYDMLPTLLPSAFSSVEVDESRRWLESLAAIDGIIATSQAVADDYILWLSAMGPTQRVLPLSVSYFRPGIDLDFVKTESPTDESLLIAVKQKPSLLMVGPLELYKNHGLALDAFERLWQDGRSEQLVIVGASGRNTESFAERLKSHSEFGKRLHWLEVCSTDLLKRLYTNAIALLVTSEAGGLELPLIEAAQYGLPIIARDNPVHREIVSQYSTYFPQNIDRDQLASFLASWFDDFYTRGSNTALGIKQVTLSESARQLQDALDGKCIYRQWLSDGINRYYGNDNRLFSQIGYRCGFNITTTGKEGFLIFGPYRELEPGYYRLLLTGTANKWSGKEWFDIAYCNGEMRLINIQLDTLPINGWQKAVEFEFHHQISDFEARLWVNEESEITLNSMIFEKLQTSISYNMSNSTPNGDVSINVAGEIKAICDLNHQSESNLTNHSSVDGSGMHASSKFDVNCKSVAVDVEAGMCDIGICGTPKTENVGSNNKSVILNDDHDQLVCETDGRMQIGAETNKERRTRKTKLKRGRAK